MASKTSLDNPVATTVQFVGTGAVPHTPPEMSYRRWLMMTLSLVAFLILAMVWINWHLDVLGLFGRENVRLYSLDRYSTYAMSYRFIPEHFDGLLLGDSITANWDTSLIPGHRIFNCSIRGANFSEQNLIARNVLAHGNPKVLIILLHPSFTSSHGRLTPYMTPEEYWSSFGSLQMLTIYSQMAVESLAGPNTHRWAFQHRAFPFGGQNFRIPDRNGIESDPAASFRLDKVAEKEFTDLVNIAHQRHMHLYFLIPPTYGERWQLNGQQIEAYYHRMLKWAAPEDHILDLHDGTLQQVTSNHADFPDYVHLRLSAAHKAAQIMAERIASSEQGVLLSSR